MEQGEVWARAPHLDVVQRCGELGKVALGAGVYRRGSVRPGPLGPGHLEVRRRGGGRKGSREGRTCPAASASAKGSGALSPKCAPWAGSTSTTQRLLKRVPSQQPRTTGQSCFTSFPGDWMHIQT